MNVNALSDKIISNPTLIMDILESLGHLGIKDRGKYITCCNLGGDNPNGISVLKENLTYQNFSHSDKGNIYTLVMNELGYSFPKALEYVAKAIGYTDSSFLNQAIKYPFHHFYKDLINSEVEPELHMKTYKESDLPPSGSLSKMWLNDGVDLLTQEKFGIRIDHDSDRIIIPELSLDGKLVGAKARLNTKQCDPNERWSMYIPFSKSQTIYGFCENYSAIQSAGTCFIVESEKSVQQLYSNNCKQGLATGGHDISKTQAKYIKGLMSKNIILAYDEGISEDELRYQAEKIKTDLPWMNSRVGYIYDRNHTYLKKGSKDSPTDVGFSTLKRMTKECMVWL